VLLVGGLVLGMLLLSVHAGSLSGHPAMSARALQVIEGLVGVTGPVHFSSDAFSDVTYDIFAGFGWLVAGVVAYLVLRPAEPSCSLSPDDETRMRQLLKAHGDRDSLGYFALRRDKSVVWSTTGKACIAYRVISGVMLASGDPIGDPEAWPGAMTRFLEVAAAHAWVPAVMGCSEQAGTVWSRQGLAALEIGDEAVVEVGEFTLEGRSMRNVRQAVARVERAGYTTTVARSKDIDNAGQALLRRQAEAWRGTETERGFSMALGRFGDPADGDCVWVTASLNGRMRAFLHFVPWGRNGLSLDLMRRDRDADNGLNEFLIVSMLRASPEFGVDRLSLNFSVFRSALERGERLGAGFVLRAWRGLLLFVSRWFQIETLYRFNAKFRPIWEPRFVCYPSAADLPRITLAALEAEAFIVWPTAWRHALTRARRAVLTRGTPEAA
jgi:lysyl-tRNA synthetase class 2